jgi:hypothetical protein
MEEFFMGRPLYPYELGDPDFSWLLSSFQENNPGWVMIESTNLPVVLLESATGALALPAVVPPGKLDEASEEPLDKSER